MVSAQSCARARTTHNLAISSKLERIRDDRIREPATKHGDELLGNHAPERRKDAPPQRVVVRVAGFDVPKVPRDDERPSRSNNRSLDLANPSVEPALLIPRLAIE